MKKQTVRAVTIDDDNWEKLDQMAKASGKSKSAILRALINLEVPKPLPPDVWLSVFSSSSEMAAKFMELYAMAKESGNPSSSDFKDIAETIYAMRREMTDIALGNINLKEIK